jgi:hypothetical protein
MKQTAHREARDTSRYSVNSISNRPRSLGLTMNLTVFPAICASVPDAYLKKVVPEASRPIALPSIMSMELVPSTTCPMANPPGARWMPRDARYFPRLRRIRPCRFSNRNRP